MAALEPHISARKVYVWKMSVAASNLKILGEPTCLFTMAYSYRNIYGVVKKSKYDSKDCIESVEELRQRR